MEGDAPAAMSLLLPLCCLLCCLILAEGRPLHRVSCYNLLSSSLADPDRFSRCPKRFLSLEHRLQEVKKKLRREMDKKAVLCLQEVSLEWSGKLHPFFAESGYNFITSSYGNSFDGYMGVGIAYCQDEYRLLNADIKRIVDTKALPPSTKNNNINNPNDKDSPQTSSSKSSPSWNPFSWMKMPRLLSTAKDKAKSREKTSKIWTEALKKKNQMAILTLAHRRSGDRFMVATYHMPCVFYLPEVMSIHAALACQYLHNQSTKAIDAMNALEGSHCNNSNCSLPYVLAGDFNLKPSSSTYSLLTNGFLPTRALKTLPPLGPGDNWSTAIHPMRSAYHQAQRSEPLFTSYASVNKEVFMGTIDYIFLSPEWRVERVGGLASRDQGPFPSEHEPSDHLLLSATLALPGGV